MKVELLQAAYVLGLRRSFGPGITEVPDFELDQLNNSHDRNLLDAGVLKVSKVLWEQKLVLVKLDNETVKVVPVVEKPLDESDEAPVVIEDLPVVEVKSKKKSKVVEPVAEV